MIELTGRMLDGLPKNGPTDPIEYYRHPLVGWLFRNRINRGLQLLGERRDRRRVEIQGSDRTTAHEPPADPSDGHHADRPRA